MQLNTIIEKFAKVKILVVGDIMLDHYINGDIYRISPEAPVPVVNVIEDTYSVGGAANVALNLANLGVHTTVLGNYSKNDDAGVRLQNILERKKVNLLCPQIKTVAPTIIKTRVVVRGQQLCRIDREAFKDDYKIDTAEGFTDILRSLLVNVNAVIISDYAKGVITQELIDQLFLLREENPQLLLAIDPKPLRNLNFKGIGLLTPNRNEALELAGITNIHPREKYPIEDVCAQIYKKYEPRLLVVTLGADGMVVSKNGEIVKHLPTEAREVFDVSGAGDTVIATLTAALTAGVDSVAAATYANIAAGLVIAHMGTSPIDLQEFKSELDRIR